MRISLTFGFHRRTSVLGAKGVLGSAEADVYDEQRIFDRSAVIAVAIDEKSPYTSGHCQRVPVLAEMIAEAACQAHQGPFKDFSLTEDEMYELRIAAWMHDCGKVTTPEYVVDKSTKLETIYDRIDLVTTRAEFLKRDTEIAYLRAVAGGSGDEPALRAERDATLARLADELAFIEKTNIGGEFLSDDDKERVTYVMYL